MAEHTSTPWHSEVLIAGSDQFVVVADDKMLNGSTVIATRICGPDAEANAAFVVKAVNNHDALLGVLREVRRFMEQDPTALTAAPLLARINESLRASVGGSRDGA